MDPVLARVFTPTYLGEGAEGGKAPRCGGLRGHYANFDADLYAVRWLFLYACSKNHACGVLFTYLELVDCMVGKGSL